VVEARRQVPGVIVAAIDRALLADPASRHPSMSAFLAELEPYAGVSKQTDPTRTRRQQRAMATVLFLVGCAIAIYGFSRGIGVSVGLPVLVLISGGLLLVWCVAVAIAWRTLRQDDFGRRFTLAILTQPAFLFVHRLVALRFDTPVRDVLLTEMLEVVVFALTLAVALERRLAMLAAPFGIGVLVTLLLPELAVLAIVLAFPAAAVLTFFLWTGRTRPDARQRSLSGR